MYQKQVLTSTIKDVDSGQAERTMEFEFSPSASYAVVANEGLTVSGGITLSTPGLSSGGSRITLLAINTGANVLRVDWYKDGGTTPCSTFVAAGRFLLLPGVELNNSYPVAVNIVSGNTTADVYMVVL
jgi:hypothetical protein